VTSGILFVCYANQCRSPMAELLGRDLLARGLGVAREWIPVSSAGTDAVAGYQMHPHAATVTAERGADPGAFRSTKLTAGAVAGAGLVLAASRRERAVCVSLAPGAMRRVFTLRQFSRLAAAAAGGYAPAATGGSDPAGPLADLADRLAAAVAAAAAARGQLQPVEPADDDLADPIGQPLEAFRRCADEIEVALAPVVKLIAARG
jgi:protein-tyrosine phosphatase